MITHRRIYHGKPGTASHILEKLKEYEAFVEGIGHGKPHRIYTDCLTGNTDHVVLEIDVESLGHLEKMFEGYSNRDDYKRFYQQWKEEFYPLIEGASAENWTREV